MRTDHWSNTLLHSTLTPSWAAAPSGFEPRWRDDGFPLGILQWVQRHLRSLARAGRNFPASFVAKRVLDVTVSALVLLILSPLFLAVAAAIVLSDGGPVFFWQQRVGLYGELFDFPKFRSMVTDAEERKRDLLSRNRHGNSVTFKMKDDPRVTRIGKWLRRFSIDELPQLWCVLKGEMSLVGPRPAVPQEVERYAAHQRNRLHTLPGLTCIWQVSGRSEIPFEQQVRLDEAYIQQQSLWLDLALLAKTVPAVLGGRGAC